jgi:peptidoglycan/LPS O-acetylase OafA/YrhL
MWAAWLIQRFPERVSLNRVGVITRTEPLLILGCVAGMLAMTPLWALNDIASSWLAGATTAIACLLMARRQSSFPARILSLGCFQFLGRISYSLYLVHFPLLALTLPIMAVVPMNPSFQLAILTPLTLALIGLVAWIFARAFERPFLSEASVRRTAGGTPDGAVPA